MRLSPKHDLGAAIRLSKCCCLSGLQYLGLWASLLLSVLQDVDPPTSAWGNWLFSAALPSQERVSQPKWERILKYYFGATDGNIKNLIRKVHLLGLAG